MPIANPKPNPLAIAIQGAKKLVTKVAQKTSGQKKTTGLEGIKYIKPKLTNLEGEKKKAVLKAKSDVDASLNVWVSYIDSIST